MDRESLVRILDTFWDKYRLGVGWSSGGSIGMKSSTSRDDLVDELLKEITNVYESTVVDGSSEGTGKQESQQAVRGFRSRVD